ncbi:MAG: nucleotidyltransferase family protein [Caldilineaceae bacterium]|nr:nucleotidyltransferase family protein [Caldilineaceae bacterium]MBP8107284.1 nucleotidyltransferase family protein [Caldilineaceae bacterium]MBP8122351.1 nucleotidyltransferase family protein [Caldilineaceae bacterium]MBP9071098.1 nucleotidyltransferase family protein [Caldilineaceae bacterium]
MKGTDQPDPGPVRRIDPFLALGARANSTPDQLQALRDQATAYAGWDRLADDSQYHGLTALIYGHLRQAQVEMPDDVRRTLAAITVRQERAAQIQAEALTQLLASFDRAGVEALVLKGGALAHQVYARPGLRPMYDLDLLVRAADAQKAQTLLGGLGFQVSAPADGRSGSFHQHLPPAARMVDGQQIVVEIHTNLFRQNQPFLPSATFEELADRSVEFQLGDRTARTLGPEEMLWHVYRHAFCNSLPWSHLRLIWVADVVSVVEAWHERMDWERVARLFPEVWHGLPLLHFLTPWSASVRAHLGWGELSRPAGVGRPYAGFPFRPWGALRQEGLGHAIAETFWPSEWWLRLHYGVADGRTVIWAWRLRHGRHILAQMMWAWPLYRRVQIPLLGSWRRSRSVLTDPPRHNNS